ncbi:sensor histidine kinase [Aliarcobacter butzleri]|uniref:histidine kinase n=3 Tax=Aliarcobacter butzleri TaxID=28197 RepID=A8EQX2_ALIB4|nr:HAMP domain-containing sensor histidine kinase [Aliarcobacter butzleri]ABV66346.1 two-component sensor histidine kinase [Aliarcobacter butzleri RM4018]AGR76399.1 two-component system histidine kinase [Aliarcobacter butzleri 7h1h]MCG3664934.1 HAMP domain-containing histidine kinase [Aliarcobacter butzleri]MCG3674521.1 HAMP domain-containing histidine kinase [Aliarcobacter butzleri]MCG3676936.1 HAMP domain-containing histidine kinase [Aliarcobacter butzleri]
MVIDLTKSEKITFFRFLFLYLGSSFILMFIAAFFYYQNEKILYIDLVKSNMQSIVSKASNEVIVSHMMNEKFDKEKYLNSHEYKISFYDKNKSKLFGNLEENIDLNEKFIFDNESIILVDNSTVGHLGIEYIALKDTSLFDKLERLKISIVIFFLVFYFIISLIGIYLAKLFLKPIKDERNKLNNFIKDTTHELNTPISAIMMSSENENLSSKQIERIRYSANRLSEIYKDLTYIFLENIEVKVAEELELSKIIKEQIDSFEPIFSRKKLKIKIELEDTLYKMNKDDFIRLFNNLFSNAIKYNKINGDIEVILKDKKLSIKDSGIGIDKNKIKDIFKRYYRATNQSGGFGLGLNIVNMICQTYKIKIEVESIENQGTTFIIYF